MKPKIAIMGCGWLGFPLAVSLVNKGNSVIGTTTSENKLIQLDAVGINSKLWSFSENTMKESLSFLNDIDVLVLNIPPKEKGAAIQYSTEIVKVCSHLSKSANVIFVSTTSVYPDAIEIAKEDYQWKESDLGKETVLAEIKLKEVLGARLTILRLAGLIGENRHPIKRLAGQIDIPNGKSPINLIHQKDAIGLIKLIIEQNFWGEIVNGCYPFHPTREKYYQDAAAFFHLDYPKFAENKEINKMISSEKSEKKLMYVYKFSVGNFDFHLK